jgi:hypothetical protein
VSPCAPPELAWRECVSKAGVDPQQLLGALFHTAGLPADCPVLLAGSVAEKIAVGSSDIDIYAICGEDRRGGSPLTGHGPFSIACGDRHLDLQLLDPHALLVLIARLERFCADSTSSDAWADSFTVEDRMILHRLASGLPIRGNDQIARFRAAIGDRHLRLKRHHALHMIKRRKCSAEALAGAGDFRNLRFICRDIADETADLLLAAANDGSVAIKWRWPRLGVAYPSDRGFSAPPTPDLWPALRDPAEAYYRLSHFPLADNLAATMRFASEVVGWADLGVLYTSAAGRLSPAIVAAGSSAAAGSALRLKFDCMLTHEDGGFVLQRLNSGQPGWEVSAQAAAYIAHLNLRQSMRFAGGQSEQNLAWDARGLDNLLVDEGFAEPVSESARQSAEGWPAN